VVEPDAAAEVGEQRPVRVALDAGLLGAVAEADELGEPLDRVRAHRRGPGRHEGDDGEQRERAPRAQHANRARAEQHGGNGEPEPEHRGHRPRQDDAERAGRERDRRPAMPDRPALAECEPDRADHERRARERRQVVDPDERRLPLPRSLPLELGHDAEKLE
jgi:hypothetical protein